MVGRKTRTLLGAAALVVTLSSALAAPAAARTTSLGGGTTVTSSTTWCQTYLNTAIGPSSKLQNVTAYAPSVTYVSSLPSANVRWTAYLQWSPASGTPIWNNWQSKSTMGMVSGGVYGNHVRFSNLRWDLNVAIGTYRFRTYDIVEFLDSRGGVVAGGTTGWVLSDSYQTDYWINDENPFTMNDRTGAPSNAACII